jgi:hypothetical protein
MRLEPAAGGLIGGLRQRVAAARRARGAAGAAAVHALGAHELADAAPGRPGGPVGPGGVPGPDAGAFGHDAARVGAQLGERRVGDQGGEELALGAGPA